MSASFLSLPRGVVIRFLLLLLPLFSWCESRAQSQQDSLSFPAAASRQDVSLFGSAKLPASTLDYLSLTEASANQQGAIVINDLPPGGKISSLTVDFEMQVTGGSTPPADGFSFSFGPDIFGSTLSEDGAPKGLSVSFDSYDNGSADASDTAPAVEVLYDRVVKDGRYVDGTRATTRARSGNFSNSTIPTDVTTGVPVTFTTGSTWVPVQVKLTVPVENQGGLVSVSWNHTTLVKDVKIPYAPQADWRIAFGARTGNSYETHRLRNVKIAYDSAVTLVVNSPFGQKQVVPAAGSKTYIKGQNVDFSAPRYVYLDRYKNTLEGTDAEIQQRAFYRADLIASDIGGAAGPASGSTLTLTGDTVVNWQWDVKFLAEIQTGSELITNVVTSGGLPLGRAFNPLGSSFNSVVTNNVYTGPQKSSSTVRGYVVENAPNSPEHCLALSGLGDHWRAADAGPSLLGTDGSFTVDFWARRDPVSFTNEQNVLALGSVNAPGTQIRAGFRADGAFFLSNNQVSAAALTSFSDNSWHHWAAVNDHVSNTITLYRDGKPIHRQSPAMSYQERDRIVTIGARADGAVADGFFAGGINNVRFWRRALGLQQIRQSLSTVLIGAPQQGFTDLSLEVPFDTLPKGSAGVYVQQVKGSTQPNSVADTAAFPVEKSYISPGLSVPNYAQVPAGNHGWNFRTRLNVAAGGDFVFHVQAAAGSQLFIDGVRLVNANGDAAETSDIVAGVKLSQGGHLLELKMFEQVNRRSLSVMYESADLGIPLQPIPPASLAVTGHDILALGDVRILSSEGNAVSFLAEGFGPQFRDGASGEEMVAAVFPGFDFDPVGLSTASQASIAPSLQGVMSDWRRVYWGTETKFNMHVDASAQNLPAPALTAVAVLPFATSVGVTTMGIASSTTGPGTVASLDFLLTEGEDLTLGTRYRTPDRRYTLSGVQGALNQFSVISQDTLDDGDLSGTVARQYAFEAVQAPGSISFQYAKTTHRAYLAIGEGLDAASLPRTNVQLIPDLPDGSVNLQLGGPESVTEPEAAAGQSSTGGSGQGYQWDGVGKKWYPLKPGVFNLVWNDEDGYSHFIEVTAAFPATTVSIKDLEDEQGRRAGSPGDYRGDQAFSGTPAEFPASPSAHYRYLVSPNTEQPFPADLDRSDRDRWAFLRLAYSESTTAAVDSNTRIFTETTGGVRSVLVYSFRPVAGTIATGDLAKEVVAVRVVMSDTVDAPLAGRQNHASARATVAARITSSGETGWDQAGFGSGYIVNEVSNYHPGIYSRAAATVGTWGAIYPVNWSGLYGEDDRKLQVGYYENPSLIQGAAVTQHPDTAWPWFLASYDAVDYPDADTSSVIFIASQIGSEGVMAYEPGVAGVAQPIYDPSEYADLMVYSQPNRNLPGFNPNEEHALVAPSNMAAVTGDPTFNVGQSAFFALQNQLNRTDRSAPASFTSEPFVLAQFTDLATGLPGMRAYAVVAERDGDASFPARDAVTHQPVDSAGAPVPQPENPKYSFSTPWPAFAGELVQLPYPLNLVVGAVVMSQTTGGNFAGSGADGQNVQALWNDKNKISWVVAGDGRFFQRYWYPLAAGFWFDGNDDGQNSQAVGTPVQWLPESATNNPSDFLVGSTKSPQLIKYQSYWRSDYPVLKRGETLTYAGGENKTDRPQSRGLPGIVGMASAQIVFDSQTPAMALTDTNIQSFGGRVFRPLDVLSEVLAAEAIPEDQKPTAPNKVTVDGPRWYFNDLTGSLNKRFYYDSIQRRLILRGRLNNLESGDPALVATPVGSYVLEPNVLNETEIEELEELDPENPASEFREAIEKLVVLANGLARPAGWSENAPTWFGRGIVAQAEPKLFYDEASVNAAPLPVPSQYAPAPSAGIAAALIPNPELLSESVGEERFLTVVENNAPTAGAVAVHIIRIGDERYRGSIQAINPQNAFDDKIQLKHTGDFGGNTTEVYYQWWVHVAAPLTGLGTPDQPAAGWQVYQQGLGLNAIDFQGRPDVSLADNLFYVRYGLKEELEEADSEDGVTNSSVQDAAWRLVSPDAAVPDWNREPTAPVPYQWAGASNSPQPQADGSRTFLPQLAMGWVKRVLDAVNPFEARYSASFNGDSPATYSSMLQQAGPPYLGPVALNGAKDAIENVGLIQLYETVLQRAEDLTRDRSSAGTDQAVLLAATRLSALYELLGSEAYADAQISIIPLSDESGNPIESLEGLFSVRSRLFAFENQVPTLMQEELALLRGTDFVKAAPVQNRLFWNYFKGEGEAAYNVNYQIQDANLDGLINESDAALLYPMGHGDAWGHFLSASKMHYGLLQRSGFSWQARSELYSLLGNVIPTDYLDEKSFARIAGSKARAGLEIINATYRDAYVADPAGQWQGYADHADPARAWGVSEWSARAGQGALFDWMVGNAILPVRATESNGQPAEGLDRIDRLGNRAELSALALVLSEIQQTLDNVNQGANPLGLDSDALTFGVNPLFDGVNWEQRSHFEQIYDLAVKAAANARVAQDNAIRADQQLRHISSNTAELQRQALMQDLDYRNRLIEMLGTPYAGNIGTGKMFKEGYTGPDLLTYMYIDQTDVEKITPHKPSPLVYQARIDSIQTIGNPLDFQAIGFSPNTGYGLDVGPVTTGLDVGAKQNQKLFDDFFISRDFGHTILSSDPDKLVKAGDTLLVTGLPWSEVSDYAFTAPPEWGVRTATGEVQRALNDMLNAQIELDMSVEAYGDYVKGMQILTAFVEYKMEGLKEEQKFADYYQGLKTTLQTLGFIEEGIAKSLELAAAKLKAAAAGSTDAIPLSIGIFNGLDALAPLRGGLELAATATALAIKTTESTFESLARLNELTLQITEFSEAGGKETIARYSEFLTLLKELSSELKDEEIKRLAISGPLLNMHRAAGRVRTAESAALRLQNERTALNMMIASKAQRNRYSDLVTRVSRNEANRKYQSAMDNALRYTWLAARAYDYETSLSAGHPAAVTSLLEEIVKTRQLGLWVDGVPQAGGGGVASVLARLMGNYDSLKGQLGLNNPQRETGRLSMRTEMMRISSRTDSASQANWKAALAGSRVDDLHAVPEFRQYCRPFADPAAGPQPGLVIDFSTQINVGRNVFGNLLGAGDHAYSVSNFATKIRSHAVWFDGYDVSPDGSQQLASAPRVYLVPAGADVLRVSDGALPAIRSWNIVNQRIPIPFPMNAANLEDPSYLPAIDSLDGSFAERIRLADFRAFPSGGSVSADADDSYFDSRRSEGAGMLYGRSVWNTRWLLIIPGATLNGDASAGLQRFIETVTDIKLQFETLSNQGM
jgi:hypothetical protein